jgi:hypothetical protein
MQFKDEYDAKMHWALGDDWYTLPISQSIRVFNLRHPEFAIKKIFHDTSFPMQVHELWLQSEESRDYQKYITNTDDKNDAIVSDSFGIWDSFMRIFGFRRG